MPTILNLPVWSLPADWNNQLVERREWLTDVMTSTTGHEQRRMLRQSPRVSLDMELILFDARRTYYDMLTAANASGDYYFPLWHDGHTLQTDLASGATSIAVNVTGREFAVPGFAVLVGGDPFATEMVSVTASSGAAITVDALTQAWPAGTKLYPARQGRFTTMPKAARKAGAAFAAQVTAILLPPYDDPVAPSYDVYSGYPVFPFAPDDGPDVEFAVERKLVLADGQTGVFSQVDTANRGFGTQAMNLWVRGHSGHAAFWSFMYYMAGKLKSVWLSSFNVDMVLTAAALSTDTTIKVARMGLADIGGPVPGRTDIEIVLRSGTVIRRPILSSALADSNANEVLTTCLALGVAFTPADVVRISWIQLARLDQDMVEMMHKTDNAGLSTVALPFRMCGDKFTSLCCPLGYYQRACANIRMTDTRTSPLPGGTEPRVYRSAVLSPLWTLEMQTVVNAAIAAQATGGNAQENAFWPDVFYSVLTGTESYGRTDINPTCGPWQLIGVIELHGRWFFNGRDSNWLALMTLVFFSPVVINQAGDSFLNVRVYAADGVTLLTTTQTQISGSTLTGGGYLGVSFVDFGVGLSPGTTVIDPTPWAFDPATEQFVVKFEVNF